MKVYYKYIFFFFLSLLLIKCVPPEEEILTEVTRDLRDSTLQKIIVFQDEQKTDSLITFFSHKDPSYRYAAAMAFGSTKAIAALDNLALLLKDPVQEVRVAAAYAIGQIGAERGANILMNSFEQLDSTGAYQKSNAAILEATGKCASKDILKLLSTISTYKASDTLLLTGQAWGIYRFALRGITLVEGTSKMLSFVNNPKYPEKVRLIAANYLGRAKEIDIAANVQALSQTLASETNPNIKMALALGLGKITNPIAIRSLAQEIEKNTDYRVSVNALRALKNAPYDSVKAIVYEALNNNNIPIATTAAQFFLDKGVPQEATLYWRKAKEEHPWQVQLILYDAANTHLPPYLSDYKGAINAELRRRFINSQIPEERAATLKMLGSFGWNYQFMLQQVPTLATMQEKTALVEGIGRVVSNPKFTRTFGVSTRRVTRELSRYLLGLFKDGDVGGMAVAANILTQKNVDFKAVLQDSLPIIIAAQQNLKLPDAIETYNAVQKVIDDFKGTTTTEPIKPKYNHPIDLNLLAKVTNSAAAVMQTDKGKIRMDLFPLMAPGTVVNFIKLAESGYFKGKAFHRVVPNFVIQGGCPRGDGYGSLDYSIRSELPLAHYDEEGYIGMASAGNHTEGTQFFITHAPTPHLDGNYTIFAKVTEGMEVVHQMEIGNKIQSVSIRY